MTRTDLQLREQPTLKSNKWLDCPDLTHSWSPNSSVCQDWGSKKDKAGHFAKCHLVWFWPLISWPETPPPAKMPPVFGQIQPQVIKCFEPSIKYKSGCSICVTALWCVLSEIPGPGKCYFWHDPDLFRLPPILDPRNSGLRQFKCRTQLTISYLRDKMDSVEPQLSELFIWHRTYYIVNCPTWQSLSLFIGSLHWFPYTQITRQYSAAMCYILQ